jgi:hypothetical protein
MHPGLAAQLPYRMPPTAPSCLAILILLVLFCGASPSAGALLTLRSRTAVDFELVGYDGLAETVLVRGSTPAGGKQQIATSYHGLALLRFTSGPGYPVLLGDAPFTLDFADPTEPPAVTGSGENEFFFNHLAGNDPKGTPSEFALLLLRAKELLESTHPIRTVPELTAKKEEMHAFVRDHYDSLRHSDMIRRLIGQYFMMHEFVEYRGEGTPATDIRTRYQQAVVDGVGNWLAILGPHIPEHEILNYCLSLYYQRSMVTLAALIAENFQSAASCPGIEKETWNFPQDLRVADADRHGEMGMGTIKGEKIIAFVSADCPVSMVATVIKARQIADQKNRVQLIVAPLQQLSETYLLMGRMVSNGNVLFIDDEQWRRENLDEKIRLPLFVPFGDDPTLPVRTSIK